MLSDVNTTDIVDAIRLGCRTMQSVFNADDHDIPFFNAQALPEALLGFECPYTESHVPGRHLSALLEAEAVAGIAVDEDAIRKHRRAQFFSLSGPLPLPLCRERMDGPLAVFLDHNIREALHGLHALVLHRRDEQARELAERCIATVFQLWTPGRGWDLARIRSMGLRTETRTFVWGLARSIGPLVKLYRATGHAPALELALVLADKATAEFYREDGAYDHRTFGTHTHSATCTLSSLAQLADYTHDSRLMGRVLAFYDNGLNAIRDQLGWVIEHDGRDGANPDRGEANNTGDVVETALILGRWGHDRCYEDADRIVRAHLLPSQLRDVSFFGPAPNPEGSDGKRAVAERQRGAFGFAAPYGHRALGMPAVHFCLDIVGGAVLSLCEVWRDAVRADAAGQHVNLLFDRETNGVRVQSPYTGGSLKVTPRQPGPLWIRIPSWVDRRSLAVRGAPGTHRFFGDRLFVASPRVGQTVEIAFALPERVITLHHRTRDIRVRLRGDAVAAMDNFGADLTFFPPFDAAIT